jgi:catechol 2,3-dioxygenase-like lactoylglutathione lyase family enzyme
VRIETLDHLVLTVRDIDETVRFYRDVLGMEPRTFGEGRVALHFGAQKINLHQADHLLEPKAAHPTHGSADLCFITGMPLADVEAHLKRHEVPVEEGPVRRTGSQGQIVSLYIRDPDGNLIELSNYS